VVGVSGVERQYNSVLMGKNGARRQVVNSHGREVGEPLAQTDAIPGKQLRLTVDTDLQIAAEEALEGKNGAIVAMDPRTGEILAMVSRPTFDPQSFSVRVTRDQWSKLVNDENHPLMNKAIQAQLAPGSTFKIIMATAGLQEGIAQDLHVNCTGGGTFYGRYFKCWISARHQSHGAVDIAKGIYQSCDVFFYTLGEKLGIDRIAKYAMALGMGQKTGIDLPQEVSGVMPSEPWKIRNFKQKWFAGETISVSIGQGAVAATPIQMARAFGAIASGGRLVRPHVTNPTDLPPGVVPAQSVQDEVTIPIDPKNWEIITDAMAQVVSPVGTAGASAIKGVDMAGKTGSAQTVSNMLKAKMSASDKAKYKDNGWFVGLEPRRNPEIVVCALFEEGEHGSLAAHVVSDVIKAYVEKQRRQPTKMAKQSGSAEIGAVWTEPAADGGEQRLRGGHFFLDMANKPLAASTQYLVPSTGKIQ